MIKKIKLMTVIAVLALLSACGGGGGSGSDTSAPVATAPVVTPPVMTNTQNVLNYITTRHASIQPSFLAAEDTLGRTLAAQGLYSSGTHYSRSFDSYVATVQSFLSDSVTNARSLNTILPVDSASVATLLRNYKIQDANYVTTYYSGVNWGLSGTSLSSVINDTKNRVNSAYDAAIANLP